MMYADVRARGLATSVRKALIAMQTDGLVQQLDTHKKTCQFVPNRLKEILRMVIDGDREKEIQKITQELAAEEYAYPKARKKLDDEIATKRESILKVREERKRLRLAKASLIEQINEIKHRQEYIESCYEKAVATRTVRIRGERLNLVKTKSILRSLRADLCELSASVSSNQISNLRVLRRVFNVVTSKAAKCYEAEAGVMKNRTNKRLEAIQRKTARVRERHNSIKRATLTIMSYVNGLADTARVPVTSNTKQVMSKIVEKEQEAAVRYHMSSASPSFVVTGGHRQITASACAFFDEKMAIQDAKVSEIVSVSEKRRVRLQKQLDQALAEIRSLQSEVPSNSGIKQ